LYDFIIGSTSLGLAKASLSQLEMKCMQMLQKFTHIKNYFGVLDPGSRFIMRKRKRGRLTSGGRLKGHELGKFAGW